MAPFPRSASAGVDGVAGFINHILLFLVSFFKQSNDDQVAAVDACRNACCPFIQETKNEKN